MLTLVGTNGLRDILTHGAAGTWGKLLRGKRLKIHPFFPHAITTTLTEIPSTGTLSRAAAAEVQ